MLTLHSESNFADTKQNVWPDGKQATATKDPAGLNPDKYIVSPNLLPKRSVLTRISILSSQTTLYLSSPTTLYLRLTFLRAHSGRTQPAPRLTLHQRTSCALGPPVFPQAVGCVPHPACSLARSAPVALLSCLRRSQTRSVRVPRNR